MWLMIRMSLKAGRIQAPARRENDRSSIE